MPKQRIFTKGLNISYVTGIRQELTQPEQILEVVSNLFYSITVQTSTCTMKTYFKVMAVKESRFPFSEKNKVALKGSFV